MLISALNIEVSISQLFLLIDSALYQAVSWLYNLFLKLAEAQVFSSEVYENFAQRVYIVLGVVMLFVLAYALLQAIVNPDNFTKGDKSFSKVAMNLVVALIIIGLLPTIFDYSRRLQNFILDSNLIGILMFGGDDMEVEVCDENRTNCKTQTLSSAEVAKAKIDTYGNVMALTTLNAFLNPENINIEYDASDYLANHGLVNPVSVIGCGLAAGGTAVVTFFTGGIGAVPSVASLAVICGTAGAAGNWAADKVVDVKHYTWNEVRLSILTEQNGGFSQIISLAGPLKKGAKNEKGKDVQLTYMPFVSSACACLLIYLLISFCIDLGIRTVRLAFLQLMAPIPVFMKAMPGKGTQFDKWVKKTIATYLEVFIRIFLMYMVVYFLSNAKINLNSREGLWVSVVIIMGLFAFVKEAPKLISEITGIDSGNMKIGIMPKLAAGGALAGAALIGAGATAFTRNFVHAGMNARKAFNDPNTTKMQKLGNVAKAGLFGLGSAVAGGASGALRGGYAGRGAKNLADVVKGASTGAKGATDARDRREAYHVAHPGQWGTSSFKDNWDSVAEWASGGFAAEEAKLKMYNDMLAAQDRAKSEAEKILNKYSTNIGLKAPSVTYKGVSDPRNVAKFEALFKDSNIATIESTINSMKENGVRREDYATPEEYAKAVQKYNAQMADYTSMFNQLKKASIKHIESLAYLKPNADGKIEFKRNGENISIAASDLTGISKEMDQAKNMFESIGRSSELDLQTAFSEAGGSGAGYAFSDALDKIEQERNSLAAEVDRKKREREARQSNKGSK